MHFVCISFQYAKNTRKTVWKLNAHVGKQSNQSFQYSAVYFDYSTSNGLNAIWHESSLIGTLLIRRSSREIIFQKKALISLPRTAFPFSPVCFENDVVSHRVCSSCSAAGETMFSMLHFCVSQRQARLEERCILCASGWRERRKWGNNVVACVKLHK